MTKSQGAPKRTKFLRNLGFVLTGVLLLVVATSICLRFSDTATMSLNEWGDFLAGVTAPLALLWLVIGYFQHGEELRLNTTALELQQEELGRQVEQTAHLAHAAQEELRLLQDREQRGARPDIVPAGRTGNSVEGFYVQVQNRGGEARDLSVDFEGPYTLKFSPQEILPSDATGSLDLRHRRGEPPEFPIRFYITCADLIGYRHTMEFELEDQRTLRKVDHTWENLAELHGC